MRVTCLAITKAVLKRSREKVIHTISHIQSAEIVELSRIFHSKKSIITACTIVSILGKILLTKTTTTRVMRRIMMITLAIPAS